MARGAIAAAATSLLPSQGVLAQVKSAPDAVYEFNLPGGDLAKALDTFSTQAGLQLGYAPELLVGKQAKAIRGRLGWREALAGLLQGSGLAFQQASERAVVIRSQETAPGPANERSMASSRGPLAMPAEHPVTDIESIVVTGTRIRGGATPSPVITIGSENIRESGFTDLGEVIRSVPQNFSGGQNPGVLMGNVTSGGMINQNATGGSGLNLRGLGPDASLTLLNGRRMAYGGFVQAVDISAIPVEAVERVEIVADGASAIYGSDAVGGVGNVILKRDFEGVMAGTRYGTATDGGLATREYNATAGGAWDSGGLIATFKRLSSDPIYASERDYTAHLPSPSTIYVGVELRSGLISLHQSFGDAVELRLDALRTEREQTYYFYSVPENYNWLSPETTTTYLAPSVEFSLPNGWMAAVGGAWGKDELINVHSMIDVATRQVSPYLDECFCNESRSYDVSAEGPLFATRAGDARLAIGAGHRTNEFLWDNRITDTVGAQGRESSTFAYAELFFPLVGTASNIAGVRRLELTAAVRSEDYDSFGRVTTPKVGLIYAPSIDFTFKASWGKSFKAPTLLQRHSPMLGIAIHPSAFGGVGYAESDILLYLNGGNPDLEPERARTWSASLAFHPEAMPGLEAELTWFDIDYTDRVVQPITGSGALTNPLYAEYVELSPSAAQVAELVGSVDAFYNLTSGAYDPDAVVAILDGRYVNTVWQRIKGLDLSGSYRFDVGRGQLTLRGAASWLDSTQQTAGAPSPLELAGTLNNPAKRTGRVGAVYVVGGFSASTFANYIDGVVNTVDGKKSASFTTFDATLRYNTGERGNAWSDLEFGVSATNLLDRAPPLHVPDLAYVAPYDSTNYSAIGRFLSVSVSKRW
ncbi:TonB-dependent receptor [Xanthomonas arboricola]|nr:TonB-dependent receptor [Xanthomonas arboricola]